MLEPTPEELARQNMKLVQAANRQLLRAMARRKRASKGFNEAEEKLDHAKKQLRLAIEAIQPPLPAAGFEEPDQLELCPNCGATRGAGHNAGCLRAHTI